MPYLKTILPFIALLLTVQFSFGQNRLLSDDDLNHSTVRKIRFADTTNCDMIEEWVKSDIKNNTTFLFLVGGIAPIVYNTDKEFENKYKVYFYDFGCILPDDKCVIKYNSMIFDYLTTVYGKKWIKEIRKDIIGFSQWKKTNKIRNRNSEIRN